MKTVYCILLSCLFFAWGYPQAKNSVGKSDLRVSLLFYPSMTPADDPVYSIDITNTSLVIKTHHLVAKNEYYRGKLTNDQYEKIRKLISALPQKYFQLDDRIMGDIWGCTLKINNQVWYQNELFNYVPESTEMQPPWTQRPPPKYPDPPPPKEFKALIDYIVSLSPISIELQ